MDHFTAHRLRFVVEARGNVELNEHQGSALRGALFHALGNRFCGNKEANECAVCPLVAACPVAFLVSTLDPQSERGRDVPRPFTVQPPIAKSEKRMVNGEWRMASDGSPQLTFRYGPGERFEFGLTLYAQALQLFPYVVLAVDEFERGGIGRRTEQPNGQFQRGRLAVREMWAENPLTGERQSVMSVEGGRRVQVPDVPITHGQVCEWASGRMANGEWRMASGQMANGEWRMAKEVMLEFLTPTRIVEGGHLLKPGTFHFQPFFQRLAERLEALSKQFSDTPLHYEQTRPLIEAAAQVEVVENRLRWEELRSYSTRRGAESPMSGLLGSVALRAADWSPFLPWLVWGQFVHVGKDAVKGNGMYRVE